MHHCYDLNLYHKQLSSHWGNLVDCEDIITHSVRCCLDLTDYQENSKMTQNRNEKSCFSTNHARKRCDEVPVNVPLRC